MPEEKTFGDMTEFVFDLFLFQNILQLQPYHIDGLMQLSEVFRMSEDVQMASELIGTYTGKS